MNNLFSRGNILIVSSNTAEIDNLTNSLEKENYTVHRAQSGAESLHIIKSFPIDMVLIDPEIPHTDGFAVCEKLKVDPVTRTLPVLFLLEENQTEEKARATKAGAIDFIIKPLSCKVVREKISLFTEISKLHGRLESQARMQSLGFC